MESLKSDKNGNSNDGTSKVIEVTSKASDNNNNNNNNNNSNGNGNDNNDNNNDLVINQNTELLSFPNEPDLNKEDTTDRGRNLAAIDSGGIGQGAGNNSSASDVSAPSAPSTFNSFATKLPLAPSLSAVKDKDTITGAGPKSSTDSINVDEGNSGVGIGAGNNNSNKVINETLKISHLKQPLEPVSTNTTASSILDSKSDLINKNGIPSSSGFPLTRKTVGMGYSIPDIDKSSSISNISTTNAMGIKSISQPPLSSYSAKRVPNSVAPSSPSVYDHGASNKNNSNTNKRQHHHAHSFSNSSIATDITTGNNSTKTATNNDDESIYSEIASSFSKNFLFNFIRRENPLKSGGLGKEYWLQDSSAVKCFYCERSFTTFRRKHHCRICGQIFCSNCTVFISGEKFNHNGRMRVCKTCLNFADQYDDFASSDESLAEEMNSTNNIKNNNNSHMQNNNNNNSNNNDNSNNSESIYTSMSNENFSGGGSLAPTSSIIDQDVIIQAPTPPPRMAIPATRQGAAVEIPIPSSRSFHRDASIHSNRRLKLAQSSFGSKNLYNFPNDSTHSNLTNAISSNSELHNDMNNEKSSIHFNNNSDINNINSKFGFNLNHNGNQNYNNNININFANNNNTTNNNINSSLIASPKLNDGSSIFGSNIRNDSDRYDDDEDDASESEDEQSMSLYASLNSDNVDYSPSNDKSGLQNTSAINSSNYNNNIFSNVRLPRVNNQTRSERAHASLLRMKNRKKSKSINRVLSNAHYQQQPHYGIHRSKTMSLADDSFFSLVNDNNILGDRNMFNFNNNESTNSSVITRNIDNNKRGISLPNKDLSIICEKHVKSLLTQCLTEQGLQNIKSWENVIYPILKQINNINPDVKSGDSFDIRQYVKLKRIPGATINDCAYVDGLIFSKNLALKSMPRELSNPRIILIMFPIEYNKTEQQYMSLELVLAQEREYLHKLVGRIIALNPDIVFIGASISGLALNMLDNEGIAVAYNLKPQVIERIARLTDADVVTSIDKLAVNPKAGTADLFEVRQYIHANTKKCYMFLTGCNQSFGGTILLRGGDDFILKKVKDAIEFMVYVVFNSHLEYSLFKDEYISFIDSSENKEIAENDTEHLGYFDEFVKVFNNKLLSTTPIVHFCLPPLLVKARNAEKKLKDAEAMLEELPKFEEKVGNRDEINKNESTEQKLNNAKIVELDDEEHEIANSKKPEIISDSENHGTSKILKIEKFLGDKEYDLKTALFIVQQKIALEKQNFQICKRQWELFYHHSPYILDATSHQSILFLYSMVNSKTATPCVGPEVLGIDYYWLSDVCLGQYIEHICLTSNTACNNCEHTLVDHYRSYVHGNGKVDVIVEKFQSRIAGLQHVILMWSYCKECRQSTPVIPMSENTWKYSFGKYLELLFWSSEKIGVIGRACQHPYKHHIRYFGIYNLAVRLEYSSVETLELVVPRFKLYWKPEIDIKIKIEYVQQIRTKANNFFDSVAERLNRVKVDSMTTDKMEAGQKRIQELKEKVSSEKSKVSKLTDEIFNTTALTDHLALNSVIRTIQELSVEWDIEFQDFEAAFLPSEKEITRITAFQLRKLFQDKESGEENKPTGEFKDVESEKSREKYDEKSEDKNENNVANKEPGEDKTATINEEDIRKEDEGQQVQDEEDKNDNLKLHKKMSKSSSVLQKVSAMEAMLEGEKVHPELSRSLAQHDFSSEGQANTKQGLPVSPLKSQSYSSTRLHDIQGIQGKIQQDNSRKFSQASSSNSTLLATSKSASHPDTKSTKELELELRKDNSVTNVNKGEKKGDVEDNNESKVKKLTSLFDQLHFDQISMEFELQRERERKKLIANRYKAIPVIASKPIVEVYKNVHDAVVEEDESEDDVNHISKSKKKDVGGETDNSVGIGNDKLKHEEEVNSSKEVMKEVSEGTEDKLINQQQQQQREKNLNIGPDTESQKSEIPQTERVSLMKTLTNFWADRSATLWKPLDYPLNSSEHIFVDSDVLVREDEPSSLIAFCLSSSDYMSKLGLTKETNNNDNVSINTGNLNNSGETTMPGLEEIMLKKTAIHLKYQFQEGASTLSCKIFFAEQFNAFRQQCGCDGNFIQSLSRCIKWDSAGGKSGSAFLKTLDDRFIIKELSHSEMDAFVKFAPSYFEYLAQALFHDLPTVLAKIFGFFQIQIINPINGKNFKMDVIIMENLFYDRKTSRIFDLKGSMRNRHVRQTGKENEVLLDENMVEYIFESPLFVKEHAKKLLRTSLWNDTLFLSRMNVMDYSLVIGIDSENQELVVGIIDCIRTFTWDKKLESWVKEKGLVGGGGKEPTVVTPRQYKNRFRDAMDRYILMVPDCWYQGPVEAEDAKYLYGVFGYCTISSSTCSTAAANYQVSTLDSTDDWTLSDTTRDTLAKILIVMPVAAGLTFFALILSVLGCFKQCRQSLVFRIISLILTVLAFIAAALICIITLLVFYPHVKWAAWIQIGSAVANFFGLISAATFVKLINGGGEDDDDLTSMERGNAEDSYFKSKLIDDATGADQDNFKGPAFDFKTPGYTTDVVNSSNSSSTEKKSLNDITVNQGGYASSGSATAISKNPTPNLLAGPNGSSVRSEAPAIVPEVAEPSVDLDNRQPTIPQLANPYIQAGNPYAPRGRGGDDVDDEDIEDDLNFGAGAAAAGAAVVGVGNNNNLNRNPNNNIKQNNITVGDDRNIINGGEPFVDPASDDSHSSELGSDFTSVSQRAINPKYYRGAGNGPQNINPMSNRPQQPFPQQQLPPQAMGYPPQGFPPQQSLPPAGYGRPVYYPPPHPQQQRFMPQGPMQPQPYVNRYKRNVARQNTSDMLLTNNPNFAVGRPSNNRPMQGGYQQRPQQPQISNRPLPGQGYKNRNKNNLPAASMTRDSPYGSFI
ncbi:hypothetical protein PACTADRAFT_14061 [Pachysolen tannophilus NRRL Y-2460]|uniref:1-phosphatidylinositol-3-phosphate 5-kinase n=1 Tax=Pachysolen tannophilus NRRL Y-2460 TaxID=669874 RepID=A0A1E4U0J9_PACTA|nr:hypothetical protein PACTADRAFT_14061 [Pachysolen tannophilus NRRL Y-2460]